MSDVYNDLMKRYVDLLALSLTGALYEDPPLIACGTDVYDENLRLYGADWPSTALTMIGQKRLDNVVQLIRSVIGNKVPGDFVETGVWRGGACIMACGVLKAHRVTDRRVIACDSFAGLPAGNGEKYPHDADSDFHSYTDLAVSLDEVKANFARYGLLDDMVVFVEGWFNESMSRVPSKQIAVLRLDGDMYESTICPLEHLYDRVPEGGWIIVDDYHVVPACKAAVHDFFSGRSLKPVLHEIDGTGVCLQKNTTGMV